MSQPTRIGIVGPCKSGKSTLTHNLTQAGYQAHQIAQEHSFAPSMWQRIGQLDILIYLHCDYASTLARGLRWSQAEYVEQQPRLAHARQHADLELATDNEPPEEVLAAVVAYLEELGATKVSD
jgi:pantothenate kinase